MGFKLHSDMLGSDPLRPFLGRLGPVPSDLRDLRFFTVMCPSFRDFQSCYLEFSLQLHSAPFFGRGIQIQIQYLLQQSCPAVIISVNSKYSPPGKEFIACESSEERCMCAITQRTKNGTYPMVTVVLWDVVSTWIPCSTLLPHYFGVLDNLDSVLVKEMENSCDCPALYVLGYVTLLWP